MYSLLQDISPYADSLRVPISPSLIRIVQVLLWAAGFMSTAYEYVTIFSFHTRKIPCSLQVYDSAENEAASTMICKKQILTEVSLVSRQLRFRFITKKLSFVLFISCLSVASCMSTRTIRLAVICRVIYVRLHDHAASRVPYLGHMVIEGKCSNAPTGIYVTHCSYGIRLEGWFYGWMNLW